MNPKVLKILHVAASDHIGGACNAANRVHVALKRYGHYHDIQSTCRVIHKVSSDQTIIGGRPPLSYTKKFSYYLRLKARSLLLRATSKETETLQSIAWPGTGLGEELNKLCLNSPDVINLHWLGNDTISIEEIGRLRYPLVWRLPDEWAFSGAEHYISNSHLDYCIDLDDVPRPYLSRLTDLNYLTWKRKKNAWSNKVIHIVAPSNWVAGNAKKSFLMNQWPIHVVPTPLDCSIWAPLNKSFSKQALGLDPDRNYILFGAVGGLSDPRKGGQLIIAALSKLSSILVDKNISLLVFGQATPSVIPQSPCPIHFLGNLSDLYSLRLAYNASTLMVIPSLQDNLPGTGLEAHACGVPIVCFDVGGLSDIVDDHLTGRLVKNINAESLAICLEEILCDFPKLDEMSARSREKALICWDSPNVASQYADIYKAAHEQYAES